MTGDDDVDSKATMPAVYGKCFVFNLKIIVKINSVEILGIFKCRCHVLLNSIWISYNSMHVRWGSAIRIDEHWAYLQIFELVVGHVRA